MGDWLVSLLKATAPYQQKKSKRSANIGGRVILATRTQVNTLDETSRPTATLGTNYTILGADHHLLGWGETGDFRRLITFIILNLRLWRNASSASLAIIVSEDPASGLLRSHLLHIVEDGANDSADHAALNGLLAGFMRQVPLQRMSQSGNGKSLQPDSPRAGQ